MLLNLLLVELFFIIICAKLERHSVQYPVSESKKIVTSIMACLSENSYSKEIIDDLKEGNRRSDRKFQEIVHCTFNKSGYMLKQGSVDVDKIYSYIPKLVNVTNVISLCEKKRGVDAIETAYLFYKCFQSTSPIAIKFI